MLFCYSQRSTCLKLLPEVLMRIVQTTFWAADWAWGLPLIVLTVVVHVLGLGLAGQRTVDIAKGLIERRHPMAAFVLVTGATTLFATSLHAIEAMIWASAYCLLGALPEYRSSILYSLNAITSYGHADLVLEKRWQLMGALEALSGWLVFGLTTAFLFGVIQKVWLLESRFERR
jgi:hypothetical protein